jgi:hypothetical protein
MGKILQLTNDDEPGKLTPRNVSVERTDLKIGDHDAALASVDPPLAGNGWGGGTSSRVLVSRVRGVSIKQITNDPLQRPGRVFVCRYIDNINRIPVNITRDDVAIEFWGLLD